MTRLALLAGLVALVACGSTSQYQATSSTTNATTKGVGLIALRNDDGTIVRSCAVTLVDPSHVVTSSTCVGGVDLTTLAVTFADTTSSDGWINVVATTPLDHDVVSVLLATDATETAQRINGLALASDLIGESGTIVAYGQTGTIDDYRTSAAGVLTAMDATTLTVRSSGASADNGGPFIIQDSGGDLVIGVAGSTTDGTTFTFIRADGLALSQ